jgi:hypothetical protein
MHSTDERTLSASNDTHLQFSVQWSIRHFNQSPSGEEGEVQGIFVTMFYQSFQCFLAGQSVTQGKPLSRFGD